MVEFQKEHCFLVGDIHGDTVGFLEYLDTLKSFKNLTIENSDVVFLGDIGIGFYHYSYSIMDWRRNNDRETMDVLDKWAEENNNKIWVLRGNHDDPLLFSKRFFSRFKYIDYLKDGEVIKAKNDKTYLVVPGAISVDRKWRELGLSYWDDEVVKENTYKRKKKQNFDGVFAHTGPTPPICEKSVFIRKMKSEDPSLEEDIKEERRIVDFIIDKFNIKSWYNGHYHINSDFIYMEKCVTHAIDINTPFMLY